MSSIPVVCQAWEESERGWGVRPDGYTLHENEADRLAYIKAHWDSMPDLAPDEYSRPSGDPTIIDVSADTLAEMRTRGDHGKWYRQIPANVEKVETT